MGHVIGLAPVPGDLEREGVDPVTEFAHQLFEGVAVSGLGAGDDLVSWLLSKGMLKHMGTNAKTR